MKSKIFVVAMVCLALAITACAKNNRSKQVESEKTTEETETYTKIYESDLSVITRFGHPKYYGSLEKARKVWKDIDKKKIVITGSGSSFSDKTIMTLDGDKKDGMINDIQIYFKNSEDPDKITLETALEVAKEYLPKDIINQWYEFSGALRIYPSNSNDVALTRAKKRVYIVTAGKNNSPFAQELLDEYAEDIRKEAWSCPLCGGQLKKVSGPYGTFYGCSNYQTKGCRYRRQVKEKNS